MYYNQDNITDSLLKLKKNTFIRKEKEKQEGMKG